MSVIQQLLAGYGSAGGGGSAGFPQILSFTETKFEAADTTAHAVAMPGAVSAGDLLLCFLSSDGGSTVTTPAGWTQLVTSTASSIVSGGLYYKVAEGSEGGTTVDFVTSSVERAMAQVFRIQVGTFGLVPEATIVATGATTTTPDPPNLAFSWGTANSLVFALTATDNSDTPSAYPFASNQRNTKGAGATSAYCAASSCTDEVNASASNPGTFTIGTARYAVSITAAVRAA